MRVWSLVWDDPIDESIEPTLASLPGESHEERCLADNSPKGSKSQTWLKQLSTHMKDTFVKTHNMYTKGES